MRMTPSPTDLTIFRRNLFFNTSIMSGSISKEKKHDCVRKNNAICGLGTRTGKSFLFLSTGNNFHPAEQMICRGCLGQQIKQWCFFEPLIFY
jgi:hypothetical protein